MYVAHRTLVHCMRTLSYDIILQQKSVLFSDTMQSMSARTEFSESSVRLYTYRTLFF